MKTKLFKLSMILGISLAIMATIFTACEKEKETDNPPTPPAAPLTVTDITADIPCTPPVLDAITLINSNEELQALCSNAPEFDFSNASILICCGITPSEVTDLQATINMTDSDNYTLKIDIFLDDVPSIEGWHSIYLTSNKIASDATVNLELEHINGPEPPLTITDITANIPCTLLSENSVTLINSNEELQALCANAPEFDFSNASMLICSGTTSYGIDDLQATISKMDLGNYNLKIDITLNDAAVVEDWNRIYLTSNKIASDATVSLEIELVNEPEPPLTITDITTDITPRPPLSIPYLDSVILINSNEEFQALYADAPEFDFSNASILICGTTTGGIYDLRTNINKIDLLNYNLKIEILLNEAAVVMSYMWVFSTSRKIDSDASVILEVENFDDYDEYYNN